MDGAGLSGEQASQYVEPSASEEDRQWAMWTHLGPLLAAVVSSGALAPLAIVWGLYVLHVPGKTRPFVADHARELFNFALTYTLYSIVGSIVVAIPDAGPGGCWCSARCWWSSGWCARSARRWPPAGGRYYRYPMCLRVLRSPDEPA
ncbi:MAG: hypothetical protein KatS3mg103_0688 [Phycisphaerales bacterium]|nr:MAG: hypothetical protein KatS3mg103_0688 [Phycisphaerales bacterium]